MLTPYHMVPVPYLTFVRAAAVRGL